MPRYIEDRGHYLEIEDNTPDDQLPSLTSLFSDYVSNLGKDLIDQPSRVEDGPQHDPRNTHLWNYFANTIPDSFNTINRYLHEDPRYMDSPITDEEFQEATLELITGLFGGSAFNAAGGAGVAGSFAGLRALNQKRVSEGKRPISPDELESASVDAQIKQAQKWREANKPKATQADKQNSVWRETGWFKGDDDKWRFEINDDAASWTDRGLKSMGHTLPITRKLGEVLDHNELFDYYPALKDYEVRFVNNKDTRGLFNETNKTINISNTGDPDQMRSTLIHEIQHAIQGIEGFGRGGDSNIGSYFSSVLRSEIKDIDKGLKSKDISIEQKAELTKLRKQLEADRKLIKAQDRTDDQYALYNRLYGEIEARNVQRRLGDSSLMRSVSEKVGDTPKEIRKRISPLTTQETYTDGSIVHTYKENNPIQ